MYTPNYTEDGELVPPPQPQVFFKTQHNHDVDAAARSTALLCTDESKTQQHGKEEADINTIVDRFTKTGMIPQLPTPPQYADFTTAEDYHTLQNRIAETNQIFWRLPAAVRASYQNDPGAWLGDVNERIKNGDVEYLKAMGMDIEHPTPKAQATTTPKTGETPATPVADPATTA